MLYTILIAVLVALDQAVKYLVRTQIPLYGSVPFLPHLVELTYVQNTGAAFSLFSQHTWLLAAVSALAVIFLTAILIKGVVRHPFGRLSIAVVLAGAIGNLIDRVWLGYVVDMFRLLFMDFAIFNVADICVVCGGIAAAVYFIFFYEKWEKKTGGEDVHGTHSADR